MPARGGHDGQLTVGNVQRHFQAQAQVDEFRFGPGGHMSYSYFIVVGKKRPLRKPFTSGRCDVE
ncbi:hypothetical protein GGER_26390 [Serratia rubidaea]